MYYYYYLTAIGKSVWWKSHVTKIQIIQFILDLTIPQVYIYYKLMYQTCSGTVQAFLVGDAVVVSFLILFVQFYRRSYKHHGAAAKKKAAGAPAPLKKVD